MDIAPPHVELKASSLSGTIMSDVSKTTLDVASSTLSVEHSTSESKSKYPALVPLKKLPSVVRAVNVHEIDVSDSEAEEEKRDDAFETKYRHQVIEETTSPKRAIAQGKKKKTTTTTVTTTTSGGASGSSSSSSTHTTTSSTAM